MLSLRLKQLIESLGLKRKTFAERIGFTPSYISLILKGNRYNPSPRFINAVTREFHVNLDWLLKGEGRMFLEDNSEYSTADTALIEKYRKLPLSEQKIVEEIVDAFLMKNEQYHT